MTDEQYMKQALREAQKAFEEDDILNKSYETIKNISFEKQANIIRLKFYSVLELFSLKAEKG